MTGEIAPDGINSFSSFRESGNVVVNDAGQVVFGVTLSDLSNGVFRDDGAARIEVVRSGKPVPDGNGRFGTLFDVQLNQAGDVAFHALISGTNGGTDDGRGIYVSDGTSLREFARAGQSAPDGNGLFNQLGTASFNNAGQLAFTSMLRNTTAGGLDDEAILVSDGTTLRQLAREGQAVPGGDGSFSTFSPLALNDRGDVVFQSNLRGTSAGARNNTAIFVHDGAMLRTILRKGELTPTGDGILSPIAAEVDINNLGETLFKADISFDNGVTAAGQGLYRSDGTTLTELARYGQLVPSGNGYLSSFQSFRPSRLNSVGQAIFLAQLAGSSGGSYGVYRSDGSEFVEIAREGQLAPDGNGVFSAWPAMWPSTQFNDKGQIAIQVGLGGVSDPVPGFRESAIYLYDDTHGLVEVARTRQQLFGSTIQELNRPTLAGRGGIPFRPVGLSNSGPTRVWYEFTLADGRSGIALWTLVPEPGSIAIVAIGALSIGIASNWPLRRRSSRKTCQSGDAV